MQRDRRSGVESREARLERRRRRLRKRRLRALGLLALLVGGGTVAGIVLNGAGSHSGTPAVAGLVPRTGALVSSSLPKARSSPARSRPVHLVERATGQMAAPVQDAAAAAIPGGAMLLGGLSAADTSRTDVRLIEPAGDRAGGSLPTSLHDTAAVRIGAAVYLFGGGTGANTQSDQVVRVTLSGRAATVVARLPAPSSDQSAAAIGDTAYVVGGFTGSRWLDTIVAWRPGAAARVVAHLPFPLRYNAAVAAAAAPRDRRRLAPLERRGELVDPAVHAASGRTVRIGRLPSATTHAAAATLGGVAYVVGGRGAVVGTATARIVAIDPRTRRVRAAGSLTAPRSDLAAVALGDRILLAGGRDQGGTQSGISELIARHTAGVAASRLTTLGVARAHVSVYSHDGANALTGAARSARPLIYVPNSQSGTVDEIDPRTYRIVRHFAVGLLPQHVVPGLGPAHALRHQRHRQQPDADRPAHRQAEERSDPGGRPLQPLLHAQRPLRDRRRRAAAPPRLP